MLITRIALPDDDQNDKKKDEEARVRTYMQTVERVFLFLSQKNHQKSNTNE